MDSKMTWDEVLAIGGFSSPHTREVLSSAAATVQPARILEIGSYQGSTAAALCFNNVVECIHCVDDHSEFGDVTSQLQSVCDRLGTQAVVHAFDFFGPFDAGVFGGVKFNVYHYDGPHGEQQHARELEIALPHLADSFVYIVDDYSWPQVRSGCTAGLLALENRVRVKRRNVFESERMNDVAGYWNGLLVAWCEKI